MSEVYVFIEQLGKWYVNIRGYAVKEDLNILETLLLIKNGIKQWKWKWKYYKSGCLDKCLTNYARWSGIGWTELIMELRMLNWSTKTNYYEGIDHRNERTVNIFAKLKTSNDRGIIGK